MVDQDRDDRHGPQAVDLRAVGPGPLWGQETRTEETRQQIPSTHWTKGTGGLAKLLQAFSGS
jgi:hypothetical protein